MSYFFEESWSFFIFAESMKGLIAHIAALFLMMIFIIKGLQSALPFLSAHFAQKDTMEMLAEAEAENTGEQNKASEREVVGEEKHGFDFHLRTASIINTKFQSNYTAWWQNAFLPVFTPPPEQA